MLSNRDNDKLKKADISFETITKINANFSSLRKYGKKAGIHMFV